MACLRPSDRLSPLSLSLSSAQLLWDETPSSQDPANAPPSTIASDSPFASTDPTSGSSFFGSSQSDASPFSDPFPGGPSFANSFGFASADGTMDDPDGAMEFTWDSPLPSPGSVSRDIDRALMAKSTGGRVGLGVRAYLEERRERLEEADVDEVSENDDTDKAEDDEDASERRRLRDRKRKRELWNVGAMLRQRFGVDPELCELHQPLK